MLPGWVAGHYSLNALKISLAGPATRAGVALVIDPLSALDANASTLTTVSGKTPVFDILSLATGSVSNTVGLTPAGDHLIPLRPISSFVARWPALLSEANKSPVYRLAIIGGGAGGVELALAAAQAFARSAPAARVILVSGENGLLPGHSRPAARMALAALERAGIPCLPFDAAGHADGVMLSSGTLLSVDAAIITTGAAPPAWVGRSGLQTAADGFVAVNRQQQSLSHAAIFAAGDIASRDDPRITRSGLHAVRAGPIVARNLLAALEGRPLQSYVPWKPTLYLLATRSGPEDGHAIASGPLGGHAIASGSHWAASGKWLWTLKDWIDRRYGASFRP